MPGWGEPLGTPSTGSPPTRAPADPSVAAMTTGTVRALPVVAPVDRNRAGSALPPEVSPAPLANGFPALPGSAVPAPRTRPTAAGPRRRRTVSGCRTADSAGGSLRRRVQDDLAEGVPALQLPVRRPDLGERVHPGDRDLDRALADERGQFGQGVRAGAGRAAVRLDAVLRRRREVDDGVDPVPLDPEVEGELDVPAAVRVDERVDPTTGGLPDPLGDPGAVAGREYAVPGEPAMVRRAGQTDHGGIRKPGQLYRDRPDPAGRPGHHEGVAGGERDRAGGGLRRRTGDGQRTRHRPGHATRPVDQVLPLDQDVLGLAGPLVR